MTLHGFTTVAARYLCASVVSARQPIPSVVVRGPVVALTHVRIIDGTGAAPKDDMTVVISGHLIQSVSRSRSGEGACLDQGHRWSAVR
jgi:hypothetical protein